MREDRKRINVTFDIDTYEKIKAIAHKQGRDLSDVVREWTLEGLNGKLSQDNMDVLAPIIRDQIKSILEPMMERQISLTAKTCVQAGTAAYLSADAILKFVPPARREEVADSYEVARKKALQYMKGKVILDD